MTQMFVIGEDALCCALGERLVHEVLGWTLAQPAVDTKGVTKLQKELARYVGLARIHPVLCVADTDRGCPVTWLSRWRPLHTPREFLLRLAVTEAESWLLADASGLAMFLGVSDKRISTLPDSVIDPTREILQLARQSRKRVIRQEVVSAFDTDKAGPGYNLHLCAFVQAAWNPQRALQRSPSLARAVERLQAFAS